METLSLNAERDTAAQPNLSSPADKAKARPLSGRATGLLLAVVSTLLLTASPALAHKDHNKGQTAVEQVVQPAAVPGAPTTAAAPPAMHSPGIEMMDGMAMEMDRSKLSLLERLLGWLGRIHPLLIHFPIAFFPAALLTAIAGRRRPSFAAPVQFLVVAGGISAPVAAAAGLLAGMTADPEPILTYHRWLGVMMGAGAAGLGIWAWRRPWEDRGAGMILALAVMTIAIAVQGFLGSAITHGFEHLMF